MQTDRINLKHQGNPSFEAGKLQLSYSVPSPARTKNSIVSSVLQTSWVESFIGSNRSPRRGNVCQSACISVIMLRMALKEFLQHAKESRGVLGHASKQANKLAGKHWQVSKQVHKHLGAFSRSHDL